MRRRPPGVGWRCRMTCPLQANASAPMERLNAAVSGKWSPCHASRAQRGRPFPAPTRTTPRLCFTPPSSHPETRNSAHWLKPRDLSTLCRGLIRLGCVRWLRLGDQPARCRGPVRLVRVPGLRLRDLSTLCRGLIRLGAFAGSGLAILRSSLTIGSSFLSSPL